MPLWLIRANIRPTLIDSTMQASGCQNARATTIMTDAADGVHVIFATMFRAYQCELADNFRDMVRQTIFALDLIAFFILNVS